MATLVTSSAGGRITGSRASIDFRKIPVRVNGIDIPRAQIAREVQNHEAPDPAEAWRLAARALLIRALLLQEAERLGIDAMPEVDEAGRRELPEEARIRVLLEREVAVPTADEATCRRFFEQNPKRFRSAPLYAARHILLAAPEEDEARKASRESAQTLLAMLEIAPDSFASLALAHSACPSREAGGVLEQIGPGQTVPEFERALDRMKTGEQAIIETRYGFHVVQLDRKIEGTPLPFEMVHDRIASYLDDSVRQRAIRQYLAALLATAQIEGVEFPNISEAIAM